MSDKTDKMCCASYGPPPPSSPEGAQGGATSPTESPPKTETHPPPAPRPDGATIPPPPPAEPTQPSSIPPIAELVNNPPPRAPYSSSTTKREPLWSLLDDVRAEILRQENGFGSARDPYRLLPNDWISLLVGLLGRTSDASAPDVRRRCLLQVAAVALAAIRAMER